MKKSIDAQAAAVAFAMLAAPVRVRFAQPTKSTPAGWDVVTGGGEVAPKRPVTPQLPALDGMAPLGISEAKVMRSDIAALGARALAGESVACPWCAKRGVESYANGLKAHGSRPDVQRVTFDNCKHTLNAVVA